MASCAELLTPLYDLMVKRVLLSIVIHTDDTTVPVLDRTLPKTRTGRFWDYIGDVRNPYVVYDYTPRRTRDGPERFLKGFQGYLQADAFSGYDRICAGSGVKEVACWAHVRRKFFESRTSAPVLAHAALARIRQLYKIETAAEEFSAEDRRALRQRDSVPLLTAFGEWLTEQGRLAAQEPDRPGDRLRSVELGGALSLPRARGPEHRQRDRFHLHLVHGISVSVVLRSPPTVAPHLLADASSLGSHPANCFLRQRSPDQAPAA